ncbi:AGE family epimerase/isomerase [Vibrio ulleungensis]|uniref:AGE family epimerase/isomerase n=1 Tax=Vibrio ulleungensis TaxID=2807619 RepID=A0ABS2HGC0_9VIBR|nr:AGE family epimerase/isomerase [Vibrio ulleungensis]MBM7035497.1 AGE family epimerase/isomerase [Vibrio ulleungensis]
MRLTPSQKTPFMIDATEDSISSHYQSLARWMSQDVLPLWIDEGFNSTTGEFAESLELTNGKDPLLVRRGRTQPRQIFSMLLAHEMGLLDEQALTIAEKGIEFLDTFSKLEDGTYTFGFDANQGTINHEFGLYKQVFVLFCYAVAARVTPNNKSLYEQRALDLYNVLKDKYKHPQIGFMEDTEGKKNLCSNPHMHMLEATLAWELVSDAPIWPTLSDELVTVATTHLISKETGALSEFFTPNWEVPSDAIDRLVEPGHQFEWAWLLSDWARRRNSSDVKQTAKTLFDIGQRHGVDTERNLTLDQLNDDLTLRSASAHLWPQTEWIKASLALAREAEGAEKLRYLDQAVNGITAMKTYLNTEVSGLWHIKQDDKGAFDSSPAQAGLLYHVLMALAEIKNYIEH